MNRTILNDGYEEIKIDLEEESRVPSETWEENNSPLKLMTANKPLIRKCLILADGLFKWGVIEAN